ncbi:MAG TPA: cytochrome c [Terracidiphilus sp.]|nr:cytochrome c [Terracidiphilus sp.]
MNASSLTLLKLTAALVTASLFSLPAHALWGHKDKQAQLAGAGLFRDKGCAHCHGVNRAGTKKAPSLVNIRKDKQWTPEKMTSQILNGGKKMPPFSDSLSDKEVSEIINYLRSKHPPQPPPVGSTSSAAY